MATTARRRPSLAGVGFRYGRLDDLAECNRIWREGIDAYLIPMGFPPLPLENPGLQRLHAHTMTSTPERFVVAERDGPGGPHMVAFGSAIERGDVWFLSMLFVEPGEQARGLGRAVLARILPESRDGRVLATCTDAAQPISNGLYASLGMVPRMPLFHFVGRPRAGWAPPPLPAGISAGRMEPVADGQVEAAQAAELDAFDVPLLGFAHPVDHEFALRERPWRFGYRDASGALVGYGYTGEVGRIGPIAVHDPALQGPILGHLLTAVEPRGASSIWLPGGADGAFATALDAGLRIEGFPTILCWTRAFGDFTRYVPTSPGLI